MTQLEQTYGPGTRHRLMPPGSWNWHIPTPFSQGWRVDNLVVVGGQLSADEHGNVLGGGDIEVQTRNVFDAVTKVLTAGGATWRDVVKINTYYVCDEKGSAVQEFWEKMTRIRLEYLPTPGPAGTAVRVAGLMYEGFLIEVDAIAVVGSGDLSYTDIP